MRRCRIAVAIPRLVVPLALALALSACAYDGEYPYLTSEEVSESLDQGDRAQMGRTVQQVLESNKTGQSFTWSNAESGHLGTVMPTRTFENDEGQSCRDFQQTVTVYSETYLAYNSACRQADGTWKLLDSIDQAGAESYWQPSDRGYSEYGYGYPGYRYPYYHYPYYYYPYYGHHHYYGHHYYGHHHFLF